MFKNSKFLRVSLFTFIALLSTKVLHAEEQPRVSADFDSLDTNKNENDNIADDSIYTQPYKLEGGVYYNKDLTSMSKSETPKNTDSVSINIEGMVKQYLGEQKFTYERDGYKSLGFLLKPSLNIEAKFGKTENEDFKKRSFNLETSLFSLFAFNHQGYETIGGERLNSPHLTAEIQVASMGFKHDDDDLTGVEQNVYALDALRFSTDKVASYKDKVFRVFTELAPGLRAGSILVADEQGKDKEDEPFRFNFEGLVGTGITFPEIISIVAFAKGNIQPGFEEKKVQRYDSNYGEQVTDTDWITKLKHASFAAGLELSKIADLPLGVSVEYKHSYDEIPHSDKARTNQTVQAGAELAF